jgi:hypothetical protein
MQEEVRITVIATGFEKTPFPQKERKTQGRAERSAAKSEESRYQPSPAIASPYGGFGSYGQQNAYPGEPEIPSFVNNRAQQRMNSFASEQEPQRSPALDRAPQEELDAAARQGAASQYNSDIPAYLRRQPKRPQ